MIIAVPRSTHHHGVLATGGGGVEPACELALRGGAGFEVATSCISSAELGISLAKLSIAVAVLGIAVAELCISMAVVCLTAVVVEQGTGAGEQGREARPTPRSLGSPPSKPPLVAAPLALRTPPPFKTNVRYEPCITHSRTPREEPGARGAGGTEPGAATTTAPEGTAPPMPAPPIAAPPIGTISA